VPLTEQQRHTAVTALADLLADAIRNQQPSSLDDPASTEVS
jgi:hypothetical protein